MKKKQYKEILEDYNSALDSLREAEKSRKAVIAPESRVNEDKKGDIGQVDTMVEIVHQIGKIDREVAVKKLLESLERRKSIRTVSRFWKIAGSVAAVIVLFVAWQILFVSKSQFVSVTPSIQLTGITVPTIVYTGEDDSIVSFDSLDLDKGSLANGRNEKKVQVMGEKLLSAESFQKIRYNKVIIPQGYTYQVQLPDGSSVTLNAGSELRYPVRFQDSLREVELVGEGFFEVLKGDIPFVVKAGDTRVKVYGTRFNFLYSEELALSEVVLLEGSVGMTSGSEEVKIVPNERVYCVIGDSVLNVEKVDPAAYTGWLGTTFRYDRTRMDRIVWDLSRWYGVHISLAPELQEQTYTIEFDKSASVEWAMQALELITGKNIKKEGGAYTIY